ESIYQQVERIFSDTFFANSDILRKFLTYIVDQTLSGHADWLKEYTIGVNVLKKSIDFKPQDNGIVRIHAGRLRRALRHYYDSIGALDSIYITVPKGGYVPVFTVNGSQVPGYESNNDNNNNLVRYTSKNISRKQLSIAVIPFQHFQNNSLENSFVDGLCSQLSNELSQFDKLSVIAYFTVRDLWKKINEISRVGSTVNARYIMAGSVQIMDNRVRSHVELIDLENCKQVWSAMYEGEFNTECMFKLQDDIVKSIIAEPAWLNKLIENKTHQSSLVAVA
ncbi:MAG: hypothetical protein J7497_05505, partial [Chitinophagaceae bacterium]|nr:hypothetical protein [Chitinophagaceae bacterium]